MINMKEILFFCLIFLQSGFSFAHPDSLFKSANEHFLKGDYQKSIQDYQILIEQGYKSSTLYYNLGNAFYRVGKIGLAILYYEKAKLISPDDEDIIHNLNFVKLQTKDKIEKLPTFFLFDWWISFLDSLTINQFTIISYILFILLLLSVLFYLIPDKVKFKRIGFYSIFISGLFFIVSVSFLIIKIDRDANLKFGVLLSSSAIVKSSPDPDSKETFLIHEGLKFKIEDKVENWIKIKLDDGKVGWIEKGKAGII